MEHHVGPNKCQNHDIHRQDSPLRWQDNTIHQPDQLLHRPGHLFLRMELRLKCHRLILQPQDNHLT